MQTFELTVIKYELRALLTKVDETIGTSFCRSENKKLIRFWIIHWIAMIAKFILDLEVFLTKNSEGIYDKKDQIMRVAAALTLYEKTSDCAKSLERRFSTSLLFLVVAIYGSLFMPLRLVLNLFSKSQRILTGIPDENHILEVTFVLNLFALCESCQMFLRACVEKHVRRSNLPWARLLHCARHPPAFTVYRIGIVDRSVMFKLLIAVITHGALQGQLELAAENAQV
ncbi:hypothetical protein EVAR_31420_1 [Eumeta japonica]|uniref:Gustatory receptor n=1 Tax=Eumeta variegata TaxID=151549 RepID=A0A4C1UXW1_EUMVA|nr:hypothetical protein EVAR_31420_1 [Eumeta japonica]